MKKLLLAALIGAALIYSASAAQLTQVVSKWKEYKPSFYELDPYSVQPSADQDLWSEGALKDGFWRDGLNYLNFCRFVAGLDEMQYSQEYSAQAQKAALMYSAAVFGPSKPAGMSDLLFSQAQSALENSHTAFGFDKLDQAVGGLLNSRGGNMQDASERVALLSPYAGQVGFGFYEGYTALMLSPSQQPQDYDYIAWPASGAFPTFLMKQSLPWTITLNSESYSVPTQDSLTIRLENVSTGSLLELKGDGEYSFLQDTDSYVGVNEQDYTIVFRPLAKTLDEWLSGGSADIRVTVFGLNSADGQETSVQYVVNLFDMDRQVLSEYSDSNTIAAHQRSAFAQLCASGIFLGDSEGTLRPLDGITRAEFTAALLRYLGIQPTDGANNTFSDVPQNYWASGYIEKAAEIGAVNGTDPGIFSPEDPVTVEQALKILTIAGGFTQRMLLEESGGYPYAYYNLGYEVGIMDNVDDNEDFAYKLTRSDAAQMFYNLSNVTKFWFEKSSNGTTVWHRDRSGHGYGYYSFVKFS